jgi:arabinan endo-1,5-alpha-L-arabinosidase
MQLLYAHTAAALTGEVHMHDPSTVIRCDGRYYVFSTGPGIPIYSSDDGWTWQRSGKVFDEVPESVHSVVPLNKKSLVWAPDVIQHNGEYYLYYSISSWGSNVSAVGLMTNPTLNQKDSRYKWTDRGLVVNSVTGENLNAIDPGVLQAPDNTLWLTYGSYIGNVQLVQLNPKTGLRIAKDSPTYILSSESEASDLIYHDGFYYLFVNRGSCCRKKDSTYNIRMGRSKTVTGPYLDPWGNDMAHGGGTLFLSSHANLIGPGHFGWLIEDGVEKFSSHYEADLNNGGTSVLDIQPLRWKQDGWPAPGSDPANGTYQIRSKRTGQIIQTITAAGQEIPAVKQGRYIVLDTQRWQLTRTGRYYKLLSIDGKLALQTATAPEPTLEAAPASDAQNQLWQIDQATDGSYRIESAADKLALTAATGGTNPTQLDLKKYTGDDTQKWFIAAP